MEERAEVSKEATPRYETPKIVTYDKEKLLKLVGPIKGRILYSTANLGTQDIHRLWEYEDTEIKYYKSVGM